MSLIDNFMETCKVINKKTIEDSEGGTIVTWEEGATIKAAIVQDSSTLGKIAEAQGVTSLYTITTHKDVKLEYPDVIKRVSTNETFQITSDSDKVSPSVASFDVRQVSAKKWELTT